MERCKRTKKHGRNVALGLVVVAALTGLVMLGNSCRKHNHFKNPERVQKMVKWKVGDVLDDLDATDAQRRQILATADQIVVDALALRKNHTQRHAQVLAELRKDKPDAQALHALVDQRVEVLRAFAHQSVDRALKAYELLDENQRVALLEQAQEHFDAHR